MFLNPIHLFVSVLLYDSIAWPSKAFGVAIAYVASRLRPFACGSGMGINVSEGDIFP
jgi:hypothetical protein